MNGADEEDCGELESESDDGLQSTVGPAPSGFFGWNKFSGVVHHIVNKFSRVVPKTVSTPPMTAESPKNRSQARVGEGGRDRSSELRDTNDKRPLFLYEMNLRGLSSDGGRVDRVRGRQSDVGRGLVKPMTPSFNRVYPQLRKELSVLPKSDSIAVIHSPSYSSSFSRPVGQMPVVHLSPRQRPQSLRNEDRAKPVTVKIAQPDPLRMSLIRHQSVEDVSRNDSLNVTSTSVLTETVVDALKKRKRSHLDPDENETRDLEGSVQLSKRRCSREDELSTSDTPMSRGMKRRALRNDFDVADGTPSRSPDVVEGAVKKICQNSSPPSLRFGCGVRNVIAASLSSHLRWEERIMRAKSLSRAASSQDESMPLVEDGGRASSRCSSRLSRPSRANSPTHQDEDLRSGHRSDRAHSIPSSDRSTPLNLLPRLHELDSAQRAPLLVRDGSVKNRVTMLSSVRSLSPAATPSKESLRAQPTESSELKASVAFSADDFERDRDLLNSRASRLLQGFFEVEDETDSAPTSTAPLPATSGVVLGDKSTAFQASGTTSVSATLATGATGSQVQTDANSGITAANVLKSQIGGVGLSDSTTVLQNPSLSTSTQVQGGSVAPSASFTFGSSTGGANPSTTPAITVSSTGTFSTTQDSSGTLLNPAKSLDVGQKGFSAAASGFGTFVMPSSGAGVDGKLGGAISLNGQSFESSALTTSAGLKSTSVVPAFGNASNVQNPVVSFDNISNATPKASGFFGNAVGGPSAFGDANVAATKVSTTVKDNAPVTTGGFALGKLGTQGTSGILSNAKSTVVESGTTASGLSFGNMSTAQKTTTGNSGPAQAIASSFAFGNSAVPQATTSSFLFPNAGASQTTASNFAFGNSGNTQTTASGSAFGNFGAALTPPSSFAFGSNSGAVQTTASSLVTATLPTPANSFSYGNSGITQTTAGGFSFGNSGNTQTTASSNSFATKPSAGGFAFGNTSTNPATGNTSGSIPTTASAFAFGTSSSKPMVGGAFGNSGNALTTASSSFANPAATPQFSFGKSSLAATANPSSTAGVFAFGNIQQQQASGSNLTTANPFGNSMPTANAFGSSAATPSTFGSGTTIANTFGNNAAAPNAFGSNATTANAFGSNAAMGNTFGNNVSTANTFGSSSTTANSFGGSLPPSNPFNSSTTTTNPFGGSSVATANPFGTPNNFDSKSSGLQFNRPDVAATNQSTPQDLRRVLFPSTSGNSSTLGVGSHPTQSQQQPGFGLFGSKVDGNANSVGSSGGFAFGANSTPAPSFGANSTPAPSFGANSTPAPSFGANSTAGGFAFGKTAGSNPPQPAPQGFNFQGAMQSGANSQVPSAGFGFNAVSQPGANTQAPNTGFNFQGAMQSGTNPQAPSSGFNFNAATPSFAFGQMQHPSANGLPSIASFSAGPKFTPGTTYGGNSTSRTLRTKKKGR